MSYISRPAAGLTPVFAGPKPAAIAPLYRGFAKRGLDLALLLLLSPVALPLILLAAALVRLDGGPAFYVQKRVGRDGKLFDFYKLRSMHMDAERKLAELCRTDARIAQEWHIYQKLHHDPRVTRIGHFIRKTSLDELPQLLNVLKGDMSLVGPRPFMPCQRALYETAKGHEYFRMRPGITGAWQVCGRSTTSFVDRVRYDNFYARKMSLATDIALLLRTVTVVLRKTGH